MVRSARHFAPVRGDAKTPGTPETAAKTAWRRHLRVIRREITAHPAERAARSARIWTAVVERAGLADREGAHVLLFDGLASEPDTTAWFEWCVERDVLAHHPVVDGPDLRVAPGDLDPTVLDVVVVPGLGFTRDGHRLGQGGGHYDRFLPRLRADCLTIGVAFAEQVVDELPVEDHDVTVDVVVTDR